MLKVSEERKAEFQVGQRRLVSAVGEVAKVQAPDVSSGYGFIEGYGAAYGNIDAQGEIIEQGMFKKSIKERVPAGQVKLMLVHFAWGGDAPELIGTVTDAREDEYGLFIHAELSSIQRAQEARTLVQEGHLRSMSVGFGMVRWRWDEVDEREVVVHEEGKLYEVTLTVFPANEKAIITAAKSLETIGSKLAGVQTGALTEEDVSRVVDELGGFDRLEALGKSFEDVAAGLDRLLKHNEPKVTPDADLHSMREEIELAKKRLDILFL